MTRIPRLTLLLAATMLLVAIAASPAQAAKRRVPFGFFGTVLPPEMSSVSVGSAALDKQMALMARSGVESVRATFSARELEPTQGSYDFGRTDRLVAAAARRRLALLMNVTEPTRWNVERPDDPEWRRLPPRDPLLWAELMRQLVLRYGSTGSFWAQNPSLPRVPVRRWQVWNEQTAPWHWNAPSWAPGYTQLLKASYAAIHQADPKAKVVAGSLVAPRANYAPWDAIRDLYGAGAKGFFDVVSVHPFTNDETSVRVTANQTVEIVRRVRAQMRRHGDGRKPIILTEMSWPASRGKVPKGALLGLETTSRGQLARLTAAYRRLAQVRRKLKVTEAYWYTWASEYNATGPLSVMSFRYAGLTRLRHGAFSSMPVLRTYSRAAAKLEGCRKSKNARRCR